jgi:transposase
MRCYGADKVVALQIKIEELKQILELNETISTMLILKEMLKQIWRYKYRTCAKRRLKEWCELARSLGYHCVTKFASRLEKYSDGIFSHCDYPIGTSKLEGCNNKIKVIKRNAYGFHDDR